jgi:uncharacterized protein with GYD domain
MPEFLVQVRYTAAAWKQLIDSPEDRLEAVKPAVAGCGGVVIRKDFVLAGDFDLVAIIQFPDVPCAAAFYMAVMAGGAVADMKITPLFNIKRGMAAMTMSKNLKYQFPGKPGSAPATGNAGRRARKA